MMKKLLSIILILLLCLGLCAGLSACGQQKVSVRSVLDISADFSGTRTISVVYPLSTKIDSLKDTVVTDDPTADAEGVSFRYAGVEDDGYYFELVFSFKNKSEYESEVEALLGRSASVFLSQKNTYLTKGTRMAEDFDVSELIAWIVSDTAACKETKKLGFDYTDNTVKIGSESFSSASTISINECTGSEVSAISVKTSNNKAGSYSRTISFTIPDATYSKDQSAIKAYFLANTLPESKYAGWSDEGSKRVYTVIYEDMTLEEMRDATAMLLDTDSIEIFYGDKTNASTPLSEGLTYEENLDTFSFIGPEGGFPTLNYSYSLPLNTTYGEGTVFQDGHWVSAGSWKDDLYSVELKNGSAHLRIPDGIQYEIEGIDFALMSVGDSAFVRTTDFLYDPEEGQPAADYAASYFASKNVDSEVFSKDEQLVCRVSFEGTAQEITDRLVSVFGSGNFMAYEQKKGAFDLSIKTELTDYVDLGYMLNEHNAAVPMNYTVGSDGGENIVSVEIDGSETAYTDHGSRTMEIKNGVASVRYHGNIPVTSAIVIYLVSGLILLILTAAVAVILIKPKKRAFAADDKSDAEEVPLSEEEMQRKAAVSQTTTFSIFELNSLMRNKNYVDEINKDVEERLRAQDLEEQKKDIRARDLEEMSRRVYGDSEESDKAEDEAKEPSDSPDTDKKDDNDDTEETDYAPYAD